MARIHFTQNLQRHVECQDREVPGSTVAEALEAYFTENAEARSYVVDDQGALRHHMLVFVDGRPVRDRLHLADPIAADSELYVMQALSGG